MLNYMADSKLLQDKVIVITGAGDGIGKAASICFASYGATIILLGRTTSKLEQVFDEIVAKGYPEPVILPLDLMIATELDYQNLAKKIEDKYHRLDGLLHNAAILGNLGPFSSINMQSFQNVMQINVAAPLAMTKAFLPLLQLSKSASIVFTSSAVGRKGRSNWESYAISKFAVEGMMQVLADEYADTNIRVNSINPGGTKTHLRAQAYPAEDTTALFTPEEIMPTYLYLMGDDSKNINGKALNAQV